MKYGAIPENLIERFVMMMGKVPMPVIDSLFPLMKSRALMAGVSLGVFEALREGTHTADEVAQKQSLDPECLSMLLRTLVYAEYLEQDADRYSLSALGRKSLLNGSETDFTGYVMWNYTQWKFVEHLEELVRTGKGLDFHATMKDPQAWGYYQRGMMEVGANGCAGRCGQVAGSQRCHSHAGSRWFARIVQRGCLPQASAVALHGHRSSGSR